MRGARHRPRVDAPLAMAPRGPRELLAKLERDAAELLAARLLDPELARSARAAAAAERPAEATSGVIHKDFCAENLVLSHAGRIVCVDDATLSFGPHDLDLARSWWRWPMTKTERTHFEAGYREQRSLEAFARHFRFWATCVLVAAAATRLRSRAPGAREAIGVLRLMLTEGPAAREEAIA
jgi:aminoglycoside phosphotransferase (APT) family kinase protein